MSSPGPPDWNFGAGQTRSEPHIDTSPIRIGAILAGRFRLEAPLGRGGMGEVYTAIDLLRVGDPNDEAVRSIPAQKVPHSAWVAIKVVSPLLSSDLRMVADLRQEVDKGRMLTHPHIVRVHDIYEDAGHYLISMELLDGHSLEDELAKHPKGMPLARLLEILRPVAEALEYAHSRSYHGMRGVIHRDVSLKNIFIADDGVRLIDFGISEVLYTTYVSRTAQQGQFVVGTPPYMSPERFVGQHPDPRDDVYGLAVVAYECLTGRKPFYGPAIQQRPENLYPDRPPGLSSKQWNVLKRGLHFNRNKRLPSPLALIEGLTAGTGQSRIRRFGIWGLAAAIALGLGVAYVLIQEKRAFTKAQRADSLVVYRNYLQRCPICVYRQEARAAVARLEAQAQVEEERKMLAESQRQTAAALKTSVVFRDTLRNGSPGPEMVVIPAGNYWMGSPQGEIDRGDNEHLHQVLIEQPFAIGRTEITVGEFWLFVNATGYRTEAEQSDGCWSWNGAEWAKDRNLSWRAPTFEQSADHPVICVSWNDATAFAKWLSKQTGKEYRLPTEAEWEYAARAGTRTARYWGDDPHEACVYANVYDRSSERGNRFSWDSHACADGFAQTAPAARFQPNDFGLHDMLGNVWEWTCSDYNKDYNGAETSCIGGKDHASIPVVRGGAWFNVPGSIRSAKREDDVPYNRGYGIGFRLVRTF